MALAPGLGLGLGTFIYGHGQRPRYVIIPPALICGVPVRP
jgi:hypothetical protein